VNLLPALRVALGLALAAALAGCTARGAASAGTLTYGSGPVHLEVFEDFGCAQCRTDAITLDGPLSRLAASRQVQVTVRTMSYLGSASDAGANALGCVQHQWGTGTARQFRMGLMSWPANQDSVPNYGTALASDVLRSLGKDPSPVTGCLERADLVAAGNRSDMQLADRGLTTLPAYSINGQAPFSTTSDRVLTRVRAAASAGAAR